MELSLCCPSGSLIFVDVSMLHRGKPDIQHDRYSATRYTYKDLAPSHIEDLGLETKSFAESQIKI